MSVQIVNLGTGKCSTFGGMEDTGIGVKEGLSLVQTLDLNDEWFDRNFDYPLNSGFGLGRNLNPNGFYLAMRFAYGSFLGVQGDILPGFTSEQIRNGIFAVTANGLAAFAQAVDWGPNLDTGRLVDLSNGVANRINVGTDDSVEVQFIHGGA